MINNLRDIYRVSPRPADDLKVSVLGPGHQAHAAELMDITLQGAGIYFAHEDAPVLSVGGPATLILRCAGLANAIIVEATVVAHHEDRDQRHYNFRFEDQDQVKQQIPPEYHRLFNRRGNYRVPLAAADPPLEVHIANHDAPRQAVRARARLDNLSARGLGALADRSTPELLADVESVDVSLYLPGYGGPLRMAATIQHREPHEDVVYYGIQFDARHTEDYLDKAEDIVEYVLSRIEQRGHDGSRSAFT